MLPPEPGIDIWDMGIPATEWNAAVGRWAASDGFSPAARSSDSTVIPGGSCPGCCPGTQSSAAAQAAAAAAAVEVPADPGPWAEQK